MEELSPRSAHGEDSGELGRPSKRKRTTGDGGDGHGAPSAVESPSSIPPEVWASALTYLDYKSVLSCAAASKSILRDAMPLVTSLHIDKASQLNGSASSRFRDVREVNIFSLVVRTRDEEGNVKMRVCADTANAAVIFLSRFDNLERVFLGGRDAGGEAMGFGDYRYRCRPQDRQVMSSLMDQFTNAFRRNFLPKALLVLGIRCPNSVYGSATNRAANNSDCSCCRSACSHWPLEHAINFHSKGLSIKKKEDSLVKMPSYCLDVCLTREQIEGIVEARPGGHDMLHSESRLMYLLGQGNLYTIQSDDDAPLHIVLFSQRGIDEMKKVIAAAQLDVSKLGREDILNALVKSFSSALGPKRLLPKSQCYLSDPYKVLLGSLGLPFSEGDWFEFDYLKPKMHHLPQVIKVLRTYGTGSLIWINVIYFGWLMLLLDNAKTPIIQEVIDYGVLPLLAKGIHSPCIDVLALESIYSIVNNGSAAHMNALIEIGVIPKIVDLLDPSDEQCTESAALLLGCFVEQSVTCRDVVLQANVVEPLLKVLKEASGTWTLAQASFLTARLWKKDPKPDISLWKPLLEPLSQLIQRDDEHLLVNSTAALVYLLSQEAIDLGVYPRLLQLLSHSSTEIQENALEAIWCHVLRDKTFFQPLISNEVLPRLMTFMSDAISGNQYFASQIVCQIASTGSEPQIRAIVLQDCVRSFCGLLASSDVYTVELGLKGLFFVLDFGRNTCVHNDVRNEIQNAVRNEIQCIDDRLAGLADTSSKDSSRQNHEVLRVEIDQWKVLLLQQP